MWNFSLFIGLLFFVALIGIGLAIIVWKRQRDRSWAMPFMALCLTATLWTIGYGLEIGVPSLEEKLFWAKIEYIGIVAVPVSWYFFALRYSNRATNFLNRYYALFFVIPVLTVVFVFFNENLGLVWVATTLNTSTTPPLFEATYGWWFWIHSAYSYWLILAGTVVILLSIYASPMIYQRQNILLAIAALMPWVANILFLSGVSSLDFSPMAFIISGLSVGWAIFRLQLFDLIPIGRKAIVEQLEDAFVVVDLKQRIVDANPAAHKIFNAEDVQLVGREITAVLTHKRITEQIDRRHSSRTEIRLIVAGEPKTYDLITSPLFDIRYKYRGQLLVFRDVTIERLAKDELEMRVERRTAELEAANKKLAQRAEELEKIDHLKSLFLATMSHELRTPLNSILGFTEIILGEYVGPTTSEMKTELQTIYRNGEHLLSLINDILDMAKIEADQLLLETEPVNLNALLVDVVYSLKPLADKKTLSLLTQFKQEPALVMGDQNRLRQIMLNVIGNAIKFSEKGEIAIITAVHHKTVEIMVKDSGFGIPNEQLEQIFDAFYRIDDQNHRKARGTGLGLPISRRLVEMHEGKIWAESLGIPGEGSTIFIQFPLWQEAETVQ